MRWHEIIDLDEEDGRNHWELFDPRVVMMAKERIENAKKNKKLKRSKRTDDESDS